MRRILITTMTTASLALASPAAHAHGGVRLLFQSKSALATAIARQPDGKLVIAGDTGGGARYGITRITARGALDRRFGHHGLTQVRVGSTEAADATGVSVEPGGDILVVGETDRRGNGSFFGVARLLSNGRPDPSFHGTGNTAVTLGQGNDTVGWALRRSDGDLVLGGDSLIDNQRLACAGVFDANLDPLAGLSPACADPGGADDPTYGAALDGGGGSTMVAVGGSRGSPPNPVYPIFGVGRLGADGRPDAGFGAGGFTVTDFGAYRKAADQTGRWRIVARPAGGWIVGGAAPDGLGLVGFTAAGGLDPAFGSAGKLLIDADGTSARDILIDLVALPHDRLLAIGQTEKTSRDSSQDIELVRLDESGKLDGTFGHGGRLRIRPSQLGLASLDQVDAALAQPDGSVIIVGAVHSGGRHPGYAMVIFRLRPNGSIDRRFG